MTAIKLMEVKLQNDCNDMTVVAATSPCWATVQMLGVGNGGKAWASAKAPVWGTDLEQ